MQPHQFFYFHSIQCESVDAIKGNKLQCNASLVERVAVSRDYRSVDYPDIGFAHFPLARPLYICIPKYLEEKFTHHRQSFLDQQTKGHRYGGICKTNKTKELVYRSYGSTSLFLFANLSFSRSFTLSFSAFPSSSLVLKLAEHRNVQSTDRQPSRREEVTRACHSE